MADKKISALTAATTPLAGTEVLPIVQGGSTVKVSAANITAGRDVVASSFQVGNRLKVNATHIADAAAPTGNDTGLAFSSRIYPCDSAGNLTNNTLSLGSSLYQFSSIHTGDNVVIGTAGKGIDFSANTHAAGMTSELLDWYEEGTWTGTLTASTPPTTPITKTGRYTRIGNQITIAIEFDNVDTSGASGNMEVTGLPFAAVSAGYGPVMKSGLGTQVSTAGVYGGLSKVTFNDAGTMNNTPIVAAAGVYLRFSATYFV